MIYINEVLSDLECTELVVDAMPLLIPSFRTTNAHGRTGCKFDTNGTPITTLLRMKMGELVGKPIDYIEPVEVVRYETGSEYKLHCDCPWRTHTMVVYLNDDYTGGRTTFPHFPVVNTFPQAKGGGLFWENARDRNLDLRKIHRVARVESGVKYVAVVWAWDQPVDRTVKSGVAPS